MNLSPENRQQGFTLLEMVMALAIAMTIVLAFTTAELTLLDQAEARLSRSQDERGIDSVLRELEQAVRLSDEILRAGPDVLEVRGRFFVDADNGDERVLYGVTKNTLRKQVAGGSGNYGQPVVILENVDDFLASFIRISDNFDPDRWSDALPAGEDLSVNTSVRATYDLTSMGQVDPDLLAGHDPLGGYIETSPQLGALDILLSPELRVHGLQVSMSFTPYTPDAEYRPVLLGDPEGDYVALQLGADGGIRLVTREAGVVEAAGSMRGWSVRETFVLRLTVFGGRAYATVDSGAGPELLPVAGAGFLDTAAVHFHVPAESSGAASFDDVEITHTRVDLELTVDSRSHTTSARWRQ